MSSYNTYGINANKILHFVFGTAIQNIMKNLLFLCVNEARKYLEEKTQEKVLEDCFCYRYTAVAAALSVCLSVTSLIKRKLFWLK